MVKGVPTGPFSGLVLNNFSAGVAVCDGVAGGADGVGAVGVVGGAGEVVVGGGDVFTGSVAGWPVQAKSNKPKPTMPNITHINWCFVFFLIVPPTP